MKIIILLTFCFIAFNSSSQEQNKAEISTNFTQAKYGTQFTEEVEMANPYVIISDVKLLKLKRRYLKDFYQNPNLNNSNWWENEKATKLEFTYLSDKKYAIFFTPLRPNSFYNIEIDYYSTDNILSIIRMIHQEGNDNWYTQKKGWMKKVDQLNEKVKPRSLTYEVQPKDFFEYRNIVNKYDLKNLSADDRIKLIDQTKQLFENLNFVGVKPVAKDDFEKAILNYAEYVKNTRNNEPTESDLEKFEYFFRCINYVAIYQFYKIYFESYFNDKSFDPKDYIKKFEKYRENEAAKFKTQPNYLNVLADELNNKLSYFSTFPSSFSDAYKNAIVPDFGFVVFDNFSDTFQGGSPFVGFNVSLSPSNKNIPLQLSNLSIKQRLAIHTGFLLNSLKEDKKREDLFDNTSLIVGLSYKVFNHAYRVTCGTVVYKQINPIDSTKSFAFAPYIGLSIDIEIKKWIEGIIPDLKK